MSISIRLVGILALVVGLGLAVTGSAAPLPPFNPAVAAIVELADQLDQPGLAEKTKKLVDEFDSCDISRVFVLRKKGGAGIGSAAQAGHADSLQSLVQHWSGAKAPTKQELVAHRHDLLKAARVLKVMAELAPLRLAFIVKKGDPNKTEAVHKVTADFKLVTQNFHDAIAQTDPVATQRAAIVLNQTCNACHVVRDF